MAAPGPEAVARALAPLRQTTATLDAARVRNDLAIVGASADNRSNRSVVDEIFHAVYSTDVHLPSEISSAAFANGAHALLTPPFTPTSVESAIQHVGCLLSRRSFQLFYPFFRRCTGPVRSHLQCRPPSFHPRQSRL